MKTPHLVQYQGSKRILAPKILQFMPERFDRLVEPFAGIASVSIAVALGNRTDNFMLNDINAPLIVLLKDVIENPEHISSEYKMLWEEQFSYGDEHVKHFYEVRKDFNEGRQTSACMLYLLARCVKGSVRYGRNGNFNQSPDKRRHGTSPDKIKSNSFEISRLMKGKVKFSSNDYKSVLKTITNGDLVYMDPPYQGVSEMRDRRYYSGINFDEFVGTIEELDERGIDYIISYDGFCGDKKYGKDLPSRLRCKKVFLNAGLSSQNTLLGKKSVTFEALYVSDSLISRIQTPIKQCFSGELVI